MRINHEVVGRTNPSSQGLGYFEDSSGLAQRGLNDIAQGLTGLGAELKARDDATERFGVLQTMDKFETDLAIKNADLNRSVAPNDTSYRERADALFDNSMNEALKSIPPHLRDEAMVKFGEIKKKYTLSTVEFDYNQKDGWFRQGIKDAMVTGQLSIDKDWSDEGVDAVRKSIAEKIAASDLSEAEKLELLRQSDVMLLQQQYAKAAKENNYNGKAVSVTGGKVPGGDRGKQLAFVMHELQRDEKQVGINLKRAKTVDQAVAAAIGYERPAGWTPEYPQGGHGFKERLRNAKAVLAGTASAEAMQARAYFEEQGLTPEQASGLVGNLMQESGQNLNPQAIRENDAGPGKHSKGIGQWNQLRLAKLEKFLGESGDVNLPDGTGLSLDTNPRFAMIPVNERDAIKADAAQYRARLFTANEAEEKAQHDAYMNGFLTDIYKGKKGLGDIERALDSGEVDYGDFVKLREGYDKWKEKEDSLIGAQRDMAVGVSPDEKGMNAVAESRDSLARFAKGDWSAVDETVRMAHEFGVVSTDEMNQLQLQVFNPNPDFGRFALKALSAVYDASGTAFSKLPEKTQQMVHAYREAVREGKTDLEAAIAIRGDSSPAGMQEAARRREEGLKLYNTKEVDAGANADRKLKEMLSPWFATNPSLANYAGAEQGYHEWYHTRWVENYVTLGSTTAATQATNELADKVWRVTNISDIPTLMMNVPEQFYPEVLGSHDYIRTQAVQQLGLKDGEKFQIIADELTRSQAARWQKDPSQPGPTWRVIRFDAEGVPRVTDERVGNFQVTKELKEQEVQSFKYEELKIRAAEAEELAVQEITEAAVQKRPVNQSILDAAHQLMEQARAESKRLWPTETQGPPIERPERAGGRAAGLGAPNEPTPEMPDIPAAVKEFRKTHELPTVKGIRNKYERPKFFPKEMLERAKRGFKVETDEEADKELRKRGFVP